MRPVSLGAISVATTTLLTTLVEQLKASGALSNEAAEQVFSTAIARLQATPARAVQEEAIDFVQAIAAAMKSAG